MELQQKKILVVDDSETMRQMVSMTLQRSGFKILTAENGAKALQMIKETNDLNLVITDINMPVMSGLQLLKNLRDENKDISVIILTTESEERMKKEAVSLGAMGWIVKPFKPTNLSDIVSRVL